MPRYDESYLLQRAIALEVDRRGGVKLEIYSRFAKWIFGGDGLLQGRKRRRVWWLFKDAKTLAPDNPNFDTRSTARAAEIARDLLDILAVVEGEAEALALVEGQREQEYSDAASALIAVALQNLAGELRALRARRTG